MGLLGHLLEITRGSKLRAEIEWSKVPVLSAAAHMVSDFVTGASERNWKSYGHEVRLPSGDIQGMQRLLTDPQTSGGLLLACDPALADRVLGLFREHGFEQAAVIGRLDADGSGIDVRR